MKHIHSRSAKILAFGFVVLVCAHLRPSAIGGEALTLNEALRLAAENHPRMLASQSRWLAAEQRAIQAGLLPNPRLIFGAEAIPLKGNTPLKPDYLAGVGQEIPLGGRRRISKEIAEAERERETVRLSALENEIRRNIHGAFATALHAQAHEELIRQRIEIQESRAAVAAAKVKAGDDIPEAEETVHADLDHERLDYDEAIALRNRAFANLALAIGNQELTINELAGELEMELGIEAMQSAATRFESLPAIQEAEWNSRIQELRAELARSQRIPSLDLALIYRRRGTIEQNALDVEAAISIPIFNRSATTRAARYEAEAARTDSLYLRQQMKTSFNQLLLDLNQVMKRAEHTKEEILPHREKIVARQKLLFESGETNREGYDAARLELATETGHYLETLSEVHRIWSQILEFRI